LPLDQLKRVLTEHRAWLDSDGKSGEKAGLSRAQLQGPRCGAPIFARRISAT